jgi:hypothetical protein
VGVTCGKIYLLATEHYDPKGPERLRKALNEIDPGVVLVQYDFDYKGTKEDAFNLREFLESGGSGERSKFCVCAELFSKLLNYELRVCKEFAEKKDIELVLTGEISGEFYKFDPREIYRGLKKKWVESHEGNAPADILIDEVETKLEALSGAAYDNFHKVMGCYDKFMKIIEGSPGHKELWPVAGGYRASLMDNSRARNLRV